MKRTKKHISKDEAAEILLSAVSYCQHSGMRVSAHTSNGTLGLFFDGLVLVENGDDVMFVPVQAESVPLIAESVPVQAQA